MKLVIEHVNPYGLGIAHANGQRYHVPFVLAGEEVEVKPLSKKKEAISCELLEVLKPSRQRVLPPCPSYAICGGCDLQHMAYAEQLRLKELWVRDLFKRFSGVTFHSIVASPKEWHYRNRVTLHQKEGQIGFHKRLSNEVVPISFCHIASSAVNEQIQNLNLEAQDVDGLEVREDELRAAFIQVNTEQNENLIQTVAAFARGKKSQRLLELYAGGGNLSFALAEISKTVVAVEGNSISVAKAKEQSKEKQVKNLSFLCGDVFDVVSQMAEDYETFDTIVCDPPREGLKKVTTLLPRLKPQNIVYVACEMHALFRDALYLQGKGYALKDICALDMFPQTHHVEVVARFAKEERE